MTTISLTFDVKNDDYLVWQGQVVMSRSEEPYFRQLFERLAKDLQPKRVLEIGFGLGISADLVQHYLRPVEHHIVEIDTGLYADLVQFASTRRGVVPCLGDWRRASLAPPFDLVFYDPFDYSSEPDDIVCETSLLRRLVAKEGALCHPHFGDGPPRILPGFQTVILERFLVPEIDMADGTRCGHAAAVLCFPDN
ncbi:hypothetical protein Hrubri_4275 [Herbaspirillum rubrisubalbicans M1]|uniref:class I SAM-dependent methyltransferase n=1 Tax=Herbaspirillum rubrisubalbicans TaxID=80842 RepID=UPI000739F8E3|nr:class I SAM-dependent methyltransferase [Herbaspirillum rubrisubalbicans]ALU91421.1 hypothetical protein Hrubri_4275 [Herbaspirillum rubrisubalbicans M1]